ncbi:hypothetical protein [Secundilactobacillus collinoides]|nr:hypothetical protein [Secundilactobacillus collinoides]
MRQLTFAAGVTAQIGDFKDGQVRHGKKKKMIRKRFRDSNNEIPLLGHF